MTFVILFVVGMLIIPVMIDIRKYGRDNILRRSDRDLLEFKTVASMVRFFPSLVSRISETVPGALSLLLASVGLMLVGLAMVAGILVASNILGSMSMSLIERLVVILLVGFIVGLLASLIVPGRGFGIIADFCFGIIGALIGNWLLPRLGIHFGGIGAAIAAATIGALLILFVPRLFHIRDRVPPPT